ncbi:MAG: DNA repair protein RecO [Candidatus Onthoplasma sp.]
MDTKAKGVVIKLNDYKDADKLASIFTIEYGIITAKFVGVKKEKAKMKAVAQPFALAEFTMSEKAGNKVITGADLLDNFSNLFLDYNKTICGYIVLDILRSILPKEKPEADIFLLTISSLKDIELTNEYVSLISYILKFIDFEGLKIDLPDCNFVYLDKDSGNFQSERSVNCVQIDKQVYNALKSISESAGKITKEYNKKILKQCLHLLHNILFIKFNEDIKSFDFI